MRLHLPAVPHTVTRSDFSHCAFTGKVQRFAPMMSAQGYDVVHYGVEGSEVQGAECVTLLSTDEHLELMKLKEYHEQSTKFIGALANEGNAVYRQFNFLLRDELKSRLVAGDVLCLPFGHAHNAAWQELPIIESKDVTVIETGIGYPDPVSLNRVYESSAWQHWTMGKECRDGMAWHSSRNEWVVPNYYDLDDWPDGSGSRDVVVYFGRISNTKGCDVIPKLATALPHLNFVMCGQGDPAPYLTQPNIHYLPPIHGKARAELLGSAMCSLHPSRFVEPFCGAAVEAMLCGTPVVTSDFGAFKETVIHDVTGFRARSIAQWINAIERAASLDRAVVRGIARQRYSMASVGPLYNEVFRELADQVG